MTPFLANVQATAAHLWPVMVINIVVWWTIEAIRRARRRRQIAILENMAKVMRAELDALKDQNAPPPLQGIADKTP